MELSSLTSWSESPFNDSTSLDALERRVFFKIRSRSMFLAGEPFLRYALARWGSLSSFTNWLLHILWEVNSIVETGGESKVFYLLDFFVLRRWTVE